MKSILLAATALAMLSGTAFAQTSQSNSGSNATVNTASGSQSKSVSNPKVNVIGNPIGNGASSSNSGRRRPPTHGQPRERRRSAIRPTSPFPVMPALTAPATAAARSKRWHRQQRRRPAAPAIRQPAPPGAVASTTAAATPFGTRRRSLPPSVVGGNPCAVGASGGVSLAGLRRRIGWHMGRQGVRTSAAGGPDVQHGRDQGRVQELMCQDEHVHQAMVSSGKPCTADAAPIAQAQTSTIQPPAAPVTNVAAIAPTKPARPEWCWTASKAELRGRAECDIK